MKIVISEQGSRCREVAEINGRIQYIYDCLEELTLHEKRKHYFSEVDRLRVLGQSTEHLRDPTATNPRRKQNGPSSIVAANISLLFIEKKPRQSLPDRLVAYLRGWSQEAIDDDEDEDDKEKIARASARAGHEGERPRCLFGCGTYYDNSGLTRHVRATHMDDFSRPFICPECQRLGWDECVVPASPSAWSSHVLRKHGRVHTPNLRPGMTTPAYCILCDSFFTRAGFTKHFNTRHPDSTSWHQLYNCPICPKQDQSDPPLFIDRSGWIQHVRELHGGGHVPGAVLVESEGEIVSRGLAGAKRTRSGGDDSERNGRNNTSKSRQNRGLDDSTACHAVSPRKRRKKRLDRNITFLKEDPECEDRDWKDEATPDPHAAEEFWVEGRE